DFGFWISIRTISAGNNFAEGGEGLLDVVVGRERADAEADGAGGPGVEVLVDQRRAVQPGTDLNLESRVQQRRQLARIVALDGDREQTYRGMPGEGPYIVTPGKP